MSDTNPQKPTLVIIDDITVLEWIGFSALSVARFVRALLSLSSKRCASLIIRHHVIIPDEPDKLFRHLIQICAYHIEVRSISSGRSGAVSGEIALHVGPSLNDTKLGLVSQTFATQYRLTETGSVFFEKGMGKGVI
jgi:hypothetical protein